MKTVKINIKQTQWEKLEKIAKKLRKESGYKDITAEKINQYLIDDYLKK